jgi:hypothetical protein
MKPNPILNLRQRADRALFLSDRALGRVPMAMADERVRVKAHARWAGLADDEYTIAEVVGADENAMCKLRTRNGRYIKWFRATDLEPARPTEASVNTSIEQRAAAFADRVRALSKSCTLRDAISLAAQQDAEGAEAYRALGVGATVATEAKRASVLSLSARSGETFDAMCQRLATERGIPLRQAVREVSLARPDLAATR